MPAASLQQRLALLKTDSSTTTSGHSAGRSSEQAVLLAASGGSRSTLHHPDAALPTTRSRAGDFRRSRINANPRPLTGQPFHRPGIIPRAHPLPDGRAVSTAPQLHRQDGGHCELHNDPARSTPSSRCQSTFAGGRRCCTTNHNDRCQHRLMTPGCYFQPSTLTRPHGVFHRGRSADDADRSANGQAITSAQPSLDAPAQQ